MKWARYFIISKKKKRPPPLRRRMPFKLCGTSGAVLASGEEWKAHAQSTRVSLAIRGSTSSSVLVVVAVHFCHSTPTTRAISKNK